MNIAIPIDHFNINNVFFLEAIKNTIMNNSNFIRIIYSDSLVTLNGICLEFSVPVTQVEKSFNKYKCVLDRQTSNAIVENICKIENDIISKCNLKEKQAVFRISEQFKNGIIKITNNTTIDNNKKFTIKISGICIISLLTISNLYISIRIILSIELMKRTALSSHM